MCLLSFYFLFASLRLNSLHLSRALSRPLAPSVLLFLIFFFILLFYRQDLRPGFGRCSRCLPAAGPQQPCCLRCVLVFVFQSAIVKCFLKATTTSLVLSILSSMPLTPTCACKKASVAHDSMVLPAPIDLHASCSLDSYRIAPPFFSPAIRYLPITVTKTSDPFCSFSRPCLVPVAIHTRTYCTC